MKRTFYVRHPRSKNKLRKAVALTAVCTFLLVSLFGATFALEEGESEDPGESTEITSDDPADAEEIVEPDEPGEPDELEPGELDESDGSDELEPGESEELEEPGEDVGLLKLMAALAAEGSVEVHTRGELDTVLGAVVVDTTIRLAADYVHSGGEIAVSTSYAVTIDGSAANFGSGGGTFEFDNQGSGTITLKNMAFDGGAYKALVLKGKTYIISGGTFKNMTDTVVTLGDDVTLAVTGSVFRGNSGDGGALNAAAGIATKVTLRDCSFIDNHNTARGGGAVVLAGGSTEDRRASMIINGCNFSGNYSVTGGQRGQGGAISGVYIQYTRIDIRDSVFDGNEDRQQDGNGDGGALAIRNAGAGLEDCVVTISGSTFTNNKACDDGGAMLIEGANRSLDLPSALKATITNCTFVGNVAGYDGSVAGNEGGAVCFYGVLDSIITHCTFYDNTARGGYTSSFRLTGGGAVSLGTGWNTALRAPVLSNNIFIGNKCLADDSKTGGNIAIVAQADAGDPKNNGNVGYDNNKVSGYSQGENPAAHITVANVFANVQGGVPVREYYGSAGAPGHTASLFCYIPSPLSDEMYRDGSGPYHDPAVRHDVRGYTRDHYANAGAVEIYWTRFDPNVADGGTWKGSLPAGAIRSLNNPNVFYLVTTPASSSKPAGNVITFPRTNIAHADPDYGFQGWKSNQPNTAGGTDYPVVAPSVSVLSTKQHYTAVWEKDYFRVDFNLQYADADGVAQWLAPIGRVFRGTTVTAPAAPTRTGFTFGGWYKEAACTSVWRFASDAVNTDVTLYARWTAVTDGGGGRPDPPPPPTPETPPTPPTETPTNPPVTPGGNRPVPTAPPAAAPIVPTVPLIARVVAQPAAPVIVETPVIEPAAVVTPEPRAPRPAPPTPEPVAESVLAGISPLGIPLAAPHGEAWSILNLILTALSVAVAALAVLRFRRNRRNEALAGRAEEQGAKRKPGFMFTATATGFAVLAVIVCILTENVSLPPAWFDRYSPLMFVLFAAVAVSATLAGRAYKSELSDAPPLA